MNSRRTIILLAVPVVVLAGALAWYVSTPAPSAVSHEESRSSIELPLQSRSADSRTETFAGRDMHSDEASPFAEVDRELAKAQLSGSGSAVEEDSREDVANPPPPLYPVAFSEPSVQLTEEQRSILDMVRQQFTDAVGGPGQNPEDPGYRARWEAAQPACDEKVKAWLGLSVFTALEIAANSEEARLSESRN